MPAPIVWANTVLCVDAEMRAFESDVASWFGDEGDGSKWRALAKKIIGERLDIQLAKLEVETEEPDVKNLIGNPECLNTAATYLSLHLCANDNSLAPGDLYDRKAVMYLEKFEQELPQAFLVLSLDLDESGTIEDTEKYAGAQYTGVRLRAGG